MKEDGRIIFRGKRTQTAVARCRARLKRAAGREIVRFNERKEKEHRENEEEGKTKKKNRTREIHQTPKVADEKQSSKDETN